MHVENCARATSSINFSTFNILPLNTSQKYPYFTFSSPSILLNYFCCYFSHVPRAGQVQKVLSFSWNLALRGYTDTYNDAHYEIIGVDESTVSTSVE